MRLVIVESPAKCSKIQGFLGSGYRVIASMGHIRALVQDIKSIGLDNDFEPTYEFMSEKARAIKQIRDEARGAEQVILCSDDDREGEAIAYSVALLLKLNPSTNPRAAFREITKNAVVSAIGSPRTIDMNRVHSQQARAMLDMMVGFTISPLLWKHVAPALSAGRCQTPALRLVCEREDIISNFKSEGSWAITGSWSVVGSKVTWPASLRDALSDEESSLNYLENLKDETAGKVRTADTRPWTESPPQALMTSTLQQQASNLFGCNPKRTMQIAQKLYEAGHITYMRTDQTSMSEEAVLQAHKIIEARWGKPYLGSAPGAPAQAKKTKKAKEEVAQAQEAHEAIRPTHFENSHLPDSEDWGSTDRRIYHLIWLRAIQSVMSPAKGDNRIVVFDSAVDDGDFPWDAKWRRTTFPGWRAADEKENKAAIAFAGEDASEESDSGVKDWVLAESLVPGTTLIWHSLAAKPQETKPPGRFTEATLVRELEKKGIGRPSTFASLIATITEKAYVEVRDIPTETREVKAYALEKPSQWPPKASIQTMKRGGEKARMVPTALGKTMLDFALKHFPDLFAFEFTAGMETRLDKVAEGAEPWKKVLRDTWDSYKERVSTLKTSGGSGSAKTPGSAKRREFGDGLVAVITAKGPLLLREGATKEETVFFGWPGKKGFTELTEAEAKAHVASASAGKTGESLGEFEGHPVLKKKGPYGLYAEWNGVRVNLAEGDGLESVVAKLQAKRENPTRTVGPFQIRTGPYGPYLMKTGPAGGKGKPQYVSIPAGTDIENLSAQEAGEIFEAGLKAKAARGSTGGFRGGRGGSTGRGGRGGRGGRK